VTLYNVVALQPGIEAGVVGFIVEHGAPVRLLNTAPEAQFETGATGVTGFGSGVFGLHKAPVRLLNIAPDAQLET